MPRVLLILMVTLLLVENKSGWHNWCTLMGAGHLNAPKGESALRAARRARRTNNQGYPGCAGSPLCARAGRRAGLATYFLIVWDIVRFARENGIRCQVSMIG